MRLKGMILALTAALLLSGCCSHPGIFDQIRASEQTVQAVYGPLTGQPITGNVQTAVVAADSALLLAGTLQKQACPDTNAAAQLQLQAKQATYLAAQAGVK